MKYEKYNNHPLKKKTSDCVIRALSEGLGKSWLEVYDELYLIGREMKEIPNSKDCFREYLKNFEMVVPKVEKGKKRLRVGGMGNGTYIVSLAHHVSVIKDGVLKDAWDCREKAVYRYWIIKKGDGE